MTLPTHQLQTVSLRDQSRTSKLSVCSIIIRQNVLLEVDAMPEPFVGKQKHDSYIRPVSVLKFPRVAVVKKLETDE